MVIFAGSGRSYVAVILFLNGELIVQNLDHLGIVAGVVDELEIVE